MSFETLVRDTYGDTWRVRRMDDRVFCVQGRGCWIGPFDQAGHWLAILIECETNKQLTYRLRTITTTQAFRDLRGAITQQGDREAVLVILNVPERVTPIFNAVGAYRRKNYGNRPLAGAALKAREQKRKQE